MCTHWKVAKKTLQNTPFKNSSGTTAVACKKTTVDDILSSWSRGPSLYYFSKIYFFRPTNPLISMDTVLNVSKNSHFLNSPTQLFCWCNIGMVPNDKLRKNGKLSEMSAEGLQVSHSTIFLLRLLSTIQDWFKNVSYLAGLVVFTRAAADSQSPEPQVEIWVLSCLNLIGSRKILLTNRTNQLNIRRF